MQGYQVDSLLEHVGIDEVTRVLHMFISILRRRLLNEGNSYQDVNDDCCLTILNSPATFDCLMEFGESSALFRFFKKWTGMTPAEYRRSDDYCYQFE